jgi:Na+/pantothenate symporter
VWETKGATLIVTVITLFIALNASENVFELVILSAGTMASLFSPLMIVLAARQPLTQRMAFTMMAVSGAVHLSWRFSPLVNLCYEILPGILSGVTVYYLLASMNKVIKPAK